MLTSVDIPVAQYTDVRTSPHSVLVNVLYFQLKFSTPEVFDIRFNIFNILQIAPFKSLAWFVLIMAATTYKRNSHQSWRSYRRVLFMWIQTNAFLERQMVIMSVAFVSRLVSEVWWLTSANMFRFMLLKTELVQPGATCTPQDSTSAERWHPRNERDH